MIFKNFMISSVALLATLFGTYIVVRITCENSSFVLFEVTSMSYVLSLSLSMFTVAQALTSLIHDCIE